MTLLRVPSYYAHSVADSRVDPGLDFHPPQFFFFKLYFYQNWFMFDFKHSSFVWHLPANMLDTICHYRLLLRTDSPASYRKRTEHGHGWTSKRPTGSTGRQETAHTIHHRGDTEALGTASAPTVPVRPARGRCVHVWTDDRRDRDFHSVLRRCATPNHVSAAPLLRRKGIHHSTWNRNCLTYNPRFVWCTVFWPSIRLIRLRCNILTNALRLTIYGHVTMLRWCGMSSNDLID